MSKFLLYGVEWPRITVNTKVTITEDYIEMRDGVRLYTVVSQPLNCAKCPTVLIRTPYEHVHNGEPRDLRPFYVNNPYISRGFAVVHQHCRGTGDSLGDFRPYDEREDGLDTLDFIRSQPFYNGEIYLTGGSYLATVHLSILDPTPPDVKAAALDIQTDRMYLRNYRNGMNFGWSNVKWWLSVLKRRYPELDINGEIYRPYHNLIERILGEDIPEYTGTLINDEYNDFWRNNVRANVSDRLEIPVLFTEGWYDFYIEGMYSMWERLMPTTRERSAFVVGPWGHSTRLPKKPEYHLENGDIPSDYAAEWFASVRENRVYPYAEVGMVNYYSVGGGKWCVRKFEESCDNTQKYYLSTNEKLSKTTQNGELTYEYDPEKPIDCFKFGGIFKAHEIGSVDGVLSFVSDEFDEDVDYFGRVQWRLNVSSDCEDTAFFSRIYLVENGESYNLTETITSLTNLHKTYAPNSVVSIEIDSTPIAFTIKKGMKIRVDIASGCSAYVPHANVRGHWAYVEQTKIAHNTIYFADSYVKLPIK